jgi:polar amino acid transport system substrate-binding protein
MTLFSLVILISPAVAQADVSVFINDQRVSFDTQPVKENGNIIVPFKQIFEAIGANVWYDDSDQSAHGQQAGLDIKLPIGQAKAIINNEEIPLNSVIEIINGRTMVPFSIINELIDCDVATKEESGNILLYLNFKPKAVVGSDISFAPFEFIDEDTREYVGFDIDLINAIAKAANINIEIKNVPFDRLVPSLRSTEIDAIISAMTITEHRQKVMNYTEPYLDSGLCIVVNANNNAIQNGTQLAGKTVAVLAGTYAQQYVVEQQLGADVRAFDTLNEVLTALKNNQVDAFIDHDIYTISGIDLEKNQLKTVGERLTKESFGIAVRLDDTKLLHKLNQGLNKIIESGEYTEIHNKWF